LLDRFVKLIEAATQCRFGRGLFRQKLGLYWFSLIWKNRR
jgi:hypothetical protein